MANPVNSISNLQNRAVTVCFAADSGNQESARTSPGHDLKIEISMPRKTVVTDKEEKAKLLPTIQLSTNYDNSIYQENISLRSLPGNDSPTNPLENDDVFTEKETKKQRRRHRRRRSGSLTGGFWSRKGRGLLGYAIPPPNVHTTDWRDMLAVTEYKDNEENFGVRKLSDIYPETSGAQLQPTPLFNQMRFADSDLSLNRANWITDTFCRRECARFVATNKDPEKCGCGRVRSAHIDIPTLTSSLLNYQGYSIVEKKRNETDDDNQSDGIKINVRKSRIKVSPNERWSLKKHTISLATNAFGTIEFQGGPHPTKAQYVRLGFDTDPSHIMSLFEHVWQISPPKLIITVHGGTNNFDLQHKLSRVFRKGLLKAAMTTGAWIITNGVDAGVVRHVAAALEGAGSSSRSKVVCIGICPWGLIKKRDELLGEDTCVPYYPFSSKTRFSALNNRHSYFLLVDNGSVGRYGAEIILRKRLENYIAQKQKIFGGTRSVPVVCVVLEGGSCTIRSVLDYVTNVPRVPVVVCDGSGRAADLLAFAHQTVQDDGSLPEGVRPQLVNLVEKVFGCGSTGADRVISELIMCAQQKHLMTVFRLGEKGKHDVDYAILTALLKGQNLSSADQLSLALAWNRVDIARSDIFTGGQEWPQAALFNAMMEALIHDRVDFVRVLLQNGVSMQKFLTIGRLEDLYNTDKGPPNTLYYIVRDVVKIKQGYRYKLTHIGMVLEKLMGNAYKSTYTTQEFRHKYSKFMKKYRSRSKLGKLISKCDRTRGGSDAISRQSTDQGPFGSSFGEPLGISETMVTAPSGSRALSNHILWRTAFRRDNPINPIVIRPGKLGESKECCSEIDEDFSSTGSDGSCAKEFEFRYPFSELLIWAVLTKRQEMAMCMWQHGEEALAKALIACRLYKSMATEAAEDYLEVEICEELKTYAEEFRVLSLELLEHCYQQDDAQTLQLLTYELSNWGCQTCLSLAVMVNNKQFLAHPCCQILLADLWHGGLRIRSHSNLKVICGLLCPISILMLEFKTREELLNQPQTAAEHEHDINDTSSSSSSSSSSSDDSSSSSFEDDDDEGVQSEKEVTRRSRRQSNGSVQSLNIASLFHSRRKKRRDKGDLKDSDHNDPSKIEKGEYGTFRHNRVQSGALTPPSFVRKRTRMTSYKQQSGNKSDSSMKGSIYGSKPNLRDHDHKTKLSVTKESEVTFDKRAILLAVGANLPRMRPIKFRRRLYEFYAAPITTFWAWTLSFCLFLACFTYVLLIRTPSKPTYLEWGLLAYVIAFGLEHTRKFIMSDMHAFDQKVKYFFFNYWNTITMAAVLSFIVGFVMRTFGVIAYGRVVLACNSVLWTMKLLDYMSVHPKLGPYITMAGKMVLNMSYIIVILVVSLLAFGLARQSITYPNEEWHWLLVRNIFYKPYFMLYGEVYADEIDTCGDDAWDAHLENRNPINMTSENGISCVTGHWIPPILMTFFLLIANILLMSMLIAIFNHIFDQTDEVAQQIWLFQRYRQVMEYESTPIFPPPLTPISHVRMFCKYIQWRCNRKSYENPSDKNRNVFDFSLKLFLDQDQVEKLHDFEEDCMDDLARKKENKKNTSSEERIHRTAERTDLILVRMNDLTTKEMALREAMGEMDNRLMNIEKNQEEMLDLIRSLLSQQPLGLRAPYSPAPESRPLEIVTEHSPNLAYSVERIAPLPIAQRRPRTNTFCVGAQSTDDALLSPDPTSAHLRFSSQLSLEQSNAKAMAKRRQRHEEYTSITDAIAFDPRDRRLLGLKSHSSDRPGSPDSDGGHSDNDKSMRVPSPARYVVQERRKEMNEVKSKRDEEGLADCELTDVLSENDDIEDRRIISHQSSDDLKCSVIDECANPVSSRRASISGKNSPDQD